MAKRAPGTRAVYRGIMASRDGQTVEIHSCTGVLGFAVVRFDDGLVCGVRPDSLADEEEQAQQLARAA